MIAVPPKVAAALDAMGQGVEVRFSHDGREYVGMSIDAGAALGLAVLLPGVERRRHAVRKAGVSPETARELWDGLTDWLAYHG